MSSGRYASGCEKRKRKKQVDEFIESQKGAIDRFFTNNSRNSDELALAIVVVEEQPCINAENQHPTTPKENVDTNMNDNNVSDHEPIFNSTPTENATVDDQPIFPEDINDPGNWNNLDNKSRDILVEKGPTREDNIVFPLDSNGKHFSYSHYSRKKSNGEVHNRKWLVYAKHVDGVFCFCCKLFNSENCKSSLGYDEFGYWKHIIERLKEHEASLEHITSMKSWNELKVRLSKHETIDKEFQHKITKDKEHMMQVLLRIIDVVKFLVKWNSTFKGSRE
jgi:hypothetical protein